MPHYQNSVIYKLKRNDDYDDTDIYVGSTTNFKNRKNQHKGKCYNEKWKTYNFPVYQFIRNNGGWGQWVMIPIEQYPCNSKKELEIRERYHIDLLRPTLNKNIPTRTIKEYWIDNNDKKREIRRRYNESHKEKIKKYRDDNKEKWNEYNKQYNKQYRIDNKEKIAEKDKQRYEANKEKYKQKIICDHCGSEIRKDGLKAHQKTKKCIESQKDDIAGQI